MSTSPSPARARGAHSELVAYALRNLRLAARAADEGRTGVASTLFLDAADLLVNVHIALHDDEAPGAAALRAHVKRACQRIADASLRLDVAAAIRDAERVIAPLAGEGPGAGGLA